MCGKPKLKPSDIYMSFKRIVKKLLGVSKVVNLVQQYKQIEDVKGHKPIYWQFERKHNISLHCIIISLSKK